MEVSRCVHIIDGVREIEKHCNGHNENKSGGRNTASFGIAYTAARTRPKPVPGIPSYVRYVCTYVHTCIHRYAHNIDSCLGRRRRHRAAVSFNAFLKHHIMPAICPGRRWKYYYIIMCLFIYTRNEGVARRRKKTAALFAFGRARRTPTSLFLR